jgi:hypothetical protein
MIPFILIMQKKYETDNVKTIIKIPTGFGEKIKNLEPVDIDKYSVLKGIRCSVQVVITI